jgi:polyhydroxybutyrate depolymerase
MRRRAIAAAFSLAIAGCPDDRGSTPPAAYPPQGSGGSAPNGAPAEGPTTTSAARAPGCGKAAKPGAAAGQRVTAAGRARTFTLVVPDGYRPDVPYPLVVVLHGGGGTSAWARTQTDLERVAAGRAVFAYPDAVRGNWDLDSPAGSNVDIALFDTILLLLHNTLCIDPRRVFLTGFSNGAYMANQLACRRGEHIRGIVTHAGGGPYDPHGSYDAQGHLVCPEKAVAALVVHGLSDTTVAPAEGQKSIDHWTFANRCRGSTQSAWSPPCVAFDGCFNPVGMCRVPGLGHGTWKEAGRVTWQFFESLR